MTEAVTFEQKPIVGECPRHGWHGRVVCPPCSQDGHVAVHVRCTPKAGKPRRYRLVYVSASLLIFRGGGREKARQEARCRMCLRPRGPDTKREWMETPFSFDGTRPLTRHHLLPLEWFKHQLAPTRALRSVDANIIPLCRQCHDEVENDDESRRMLRRSLGPDEASFAIQLAGEHWFEDRYPR